MLMHDIDIHNEFVSRNCHALAVKRDGSHIDFWLS